MSKSIVSRYAHTVNVNTINGNVVLTVGAFANNETQVFLTPVEANALADLLKAASLEHLPRAKVVKKKFWQ